MADVSSDSQKVNRASKRFSGNITKCIRCEKAVYKMEEVLVDNQPMHKICFKCNHCSRQLTLSNFAAVNNKLYCKPHYMELFQSSGGSYHVFGDAGFKNNKGQNISPTAVSRATIKIQDDDAKKTDASASGEKTELQSSGSSSSLQDKVKLYHENSSRSSLSPKEKQSTERPKSISIKDRLQQYQAATEEEEPASVVRPTSPTRRPLSGRIQERMRRFESSKSEEGEESAQPNNSANFAPVAQGGASAVAQRQADDEDSKTEEHQGMFTVPSALSDSAETQTAVDSGSLEKRLENALERLQAQERETEKWKSEFKISESNNQKLRQELNEVTRDLQIQIAKTMEADEWCAKISKDLEALKLATNQNKPAAASVVDSPKMSRLSHKESDSSLHMDGITEDANEEENDAE